MLIPLIVGTLLVSCSEEPEPTKAPTPTPPVPSEPAGPSAAELAVKAEIEAAHAEAEAAERERLREERRAEAMRRNGHDPDKEKAEMWGGALCGTIIPCYESLDFRGNFLADVSVDIEPDGSVSSVSITGDAPKPVQACITKAIEAMTVSPYNGVAGRTRCTKSGQLLGGTKMIMSDSGYERRDPAAEAAKADAAEGDGDAEKKPKAKKKAKGKAG